METKFTNEDRNRIKATIRQKYAEVSISPEGLFRYPTGRVGLEALNYPTEILRALPEAAVSSYCGVGNPFTLGQIKEGDEVLDIGCGGGVDTLAAALMVGPSGNVVGIDMVSDMLIRARKNLQETSLQNVTFLEASAENLPFRDRSFDVVLSNGVFNLIVDKARALAEVFRVLKPNGRLMIADQILTGDLPGDTKSRVESWFRWEGGAIPGKDFLALMKEVGFAEVELAAETGFNSSPITKGALFRAVKPAISQAAERGKTMEDSFVKYRMFFDSVYAEGAIDRKTKHLIALGTSLGAGCEAWTQYCLAVARELGATDEELRETMAIAMTVGATKIQIIQEKALASLPKNGSLKTEAQAKEGQVNGEACTVWPSQSRSGWAVRKGPNRVKPASLMASKIWPF